MCENNACGPGWSRFLQVSSKIIFGSKPRILRTGRGYGIVEDALRRPMQLPRCPADAVGLEFLAIACNEVPPAA